MFNLKWIEIGNINYLGVSHTSIVISDGGIFQLKT